VSPAGLSLRGVEKRYGARVVLACVDLDVSPGEAVGVLGRSGGGKTTMLRLVAGLESPDAGRIAIAGEEVSGPGRLVAPHARGVSYVFQSSALWPHMTVAGNILFGVRDNDAGARAAILADLLARLDLEGLADRAPDSLSGGEARRVALARALAPQRGLVLFDEALTNLDWDLKARMVDLVNAEVRGRATIVYVTHDPAEAAAVTDRQLLLEHGRLRPWPGSEARD
jgi:ABC-type Fe3+/spermidine/putrescine transport system ATPase subunit